MNKSLSRSIQLALAAIPALCVLQNPLQADSLSELYLNSSNNNTSSAIGPNILIVLDTSGSMTKHDLPFEVDPAIFWGSQYDPTKTYPGPCDRTLAYRKSFSTDRNEDSVSDELDVDEEDFQDCPSSISFPLSVMACRRVIEQGFAVDHFGEFRPKTPGPNGNFTFGSGSDPSSLNGKWNNIVSNFNGVTHVDGFTVWRECASDVGTHGFDPMAAPTLVWPRDTGSTIGYVDSSTTANNLTDRSRQLVASGNYINYYRWSQTRLAAVQSALREVIAGLPGDTRLGVMRFDVKTGSEGSSDGGYVMKEFVKLGDGTNRQDVIDSIFAIDPANNGGTPLGETLFEALQVFRGETVIFGSAAHKWNIDTARWPWDSNTTTYDAVASITASLDINDNSKYASPIIYECQKSAVIFLSDGDPDGDKNAYSHFKNLPDASDYAASDCDTDNAPASCMREIADYMANEDLRTDLSGDQTVTTYTVGFGSDIIPNGQAFLQEVADKGKGIFTMASSYENLKNAFQVIFRKEIAENVSLSSPAVTINAFNRMSHKNDLYFTMFDPALDAVNWPGNLKKYKLKKVNGDFRITEANDQPALALNSSQIAHDALSFWTNPADPDVATSDPPGVDGNKTSLGGAASKLPAPGIRNIYTWTGDAYATMLSNSANLFETGNANITNVMLGLSSTSTERDAVINFMRGHDVNDEDADNNTTEARRTFGAAPHGVPSVITYGTDETTAVDVIYVPTNDGFLHAIDASTGAELWAFAPTESMINFAEIKTPPSNPKLVYGLDGSVIAYTEGTAATDKKWIFFGMRRGGSSIYAIDVTNRTSPEIKWRIQGGTTSGFDQLAQTWSDPRIGKLNLGGTATPVLVFAGGYDAISQDSTAASSGYVDDTKGNAVYIVNADTGALLWRAGGSGSGANLIISDMKSSIPASVKLKDKNEDGYFDLMYAADVGGRIFRFDIDNPSNTNSSVAVTGGMIASLGADGVLGEQAANRKFFAEPDVVLVGRDGQAYWAVNMAAGDRERPKSNMTTTNYLFSIKDKNVFNTPTDYGSTGGYGIKITDLYDSTSGTLSESEYNTLLSKKGWMVKLEYAGEKGLSSAKTFDFRVFFTTFDPTPLDSSSCNSDPGTARLYAVDLITGLAAEDLDSNGLTKEDRSVTLSHGTVPPALTFMFIQEAGEPVEVTSIIGRSDDKAPLGKISAVRRTFWNIQGNDPKEQ